MYGAWASDWRECLGSLAYAFHFPPSELWEMDIAEILFWMDRLKEVLPRGR
ncbi:MAG: GpE family phage tail protein [Deltaproteobacteria bacterium]|nr:GpE family phage tail protein [Deltaproteobacteria bacterium]